MSTGACEEVMKIAVILRGVPGSGKTTLAKSFVADAERMGHTAIIHSTDDLRMVDGEYVFDPAKNTEQHAENLRRFIASCQAGINLVICDNTNIQRKDYQPYVDAAKQNGYQIATYPLPHPDSRLAAWRNIHRVPEATIAWMIENWED